MESTALGDRIQKLRKEKEISLRELARRSGISPSFLSEIENGKNFPSPDTLKILASRLRVSVASLRELDVRSQLSAVKRLIRKDPLWGAVFQKLANAGENGTISPQQMLKNLELE